MTLTDLTATSQDFGSEGAFLAKMFDRYNEDFTPVADITGMFLEGARADLSLDLPRATGIVISDGAYNRSIADADTVAQWRYLISRRQLAVIYDWLDEGEGSLNRMRARKYATEYEDALRGITSVMTVGVGSVSRTIMVKL